MQLTKRPLLSHVDLRVRDRARATVFYDALLGALAFTGSASEDWTSYAVAPDEDGYGDWFGFTQDATMTPNATRIAFAAQTCEAVDRATRVALEIGAQNIEGPNYDYGPEYYAVFFEDPDGNKLEICCCGPQARAAS